MNTILAPAKASTRIEILDIIRGFAVFGILLSNILIISGFHLTPYTDLDKLHLPGLNKAISMFSFYAIIGKAYPMFCMLFGVGFIMQFKKYRDETISFTSFYLWRMFLLFVIGLIHLIIWPGDVIHYYAIIGVLLIPFRKMKPVYILIVSAALFASSIFIAFVIAPDSTGATEHIRTANMQFEGVEFEDLKSKIQNEDVQGMWFFNKQQYHILYSLDRLKTAIIQLLAFFLLGVFLYTKEWITKKMYNWKYLLFFFIIGGIGKYLAIYISYHLRVIEHIFWSLFFMSLLGIIYKSRAGKKMLSILIPVGRMALSNYILQSVLAILVFYGVGLGLFSELPLYGIHLVAVGILILLTVFSKYWLSKYSFGSVEWLWRTLTYKKDFSLRKKL